VLVTLERFTKPARRAAGVATPTVDHIDGKPLCDLTREHEVGVKIRRVLGDN
jgi:restriction endonuclease Mrr